MVINGFENEIECSKCNKTINEGLCQFMNKYYHLECFKCKYCECSLKIPILNQFCGPLPILDKYDQLVCMDDYIK
jgi:hypothetical protein